MKATTKPITTATRPTTATKPITTATTPATSPNTDRPSRTRGKVATRRPLIAPDKSPLTAAQVLPNASLLPLGISPEDISADPIAVIRSLGASLNSAQIELTNVKKQLSTEKAFSTTYQKDAARFTGILGQIGATMGAIDWDDLPSAVTTLYQRCESYGQRADRMGEANTKLQSELAESERECRELAKSFGAMEKKRDELQSALKLASTSVEVYRRDLGSVETTCEMLEAKASKWEKAALKAEEELKATATALDFAVAEAQRLQPLLPLWARTLFSLTLLAIIAVVAHRAGFETGLGVTK